jgi:hypothetical protein
MNSYAHDKFFSKMDDELLIERAEYYISQCARYHYPATTYDETVIHVIVPELIKRLQEYKEGAIKWEQTQSQCVGSAVKSSQCSH